MGKKKVFKNSILEKQCSYININKFYLKNRNKPYSFIKSFIFIGGDVCEDVFGGNFLL
jgi:hypothetical protein